MESLSSPTITHDTFGNTFVDLRALTLGTKKTDCAIKELLPQWIETGKSDKKHTIILTLASSHARVHKFAIEAGFRNHHADETETVMKYCLRGHVGKECNYPAYKTASIGVSGVVFNQTLAKFVAIQEKSGPYLGPKAPTGIVDTGEEPVEAVVRRIFAETGIQVKGEEAVLVGEGWTPNFRGPAPDINQVFAFRIDEAECTLEKKDEEIQGVRWVPVEDFLNQPITLSHNKPFVIKKIVEVAQKAMRDGTGWKVGNYAWGSGKDIRFFSKTSF